MQGWLQSKGTELKPLTVKTVKFDISAEDQDLDLVIDISLLLRKFFMHKYRYIQTKPCLINTRNELKSLSKSLMILKQKAVKVLSLFTISEFSNFRIPLLSLLALHTTKLLVPLCGAIQAQKT